jgi:hypothetical protein
MEGFDIIDILRESQGGKDDEDDVLCVVLMVFC